MAPILDQIYRGNCQDVMQYIPDESIDLILTDPPYGIGYQSNWPATGPRFKKIVGDTAPCVDWLDGAYRVLSPAGSIVVFCRWDVQCVFQENITNAGFTIRSQIVWDRMAHGMGDLRRQFAPAHDVAWFATKSNQFQFPGRRPKSVIRYPRCAATEMVHPTQKPVELFKDLIESLTHPGEIVLDPFIGSGTTAIACIRSGRHYIGIEKDPTYAAIAQRRVIEERTLTGQ